MLGNQDRVQISDLPVDSFSEDTDQDTDTHICETFVSVSMFERHLVEKGSAHCLYFSDRLSLELGRLPFFATAQK